MARLALLGLALIVAGLLLVAASLLGMALQGAGAGTVAGGGCVVVFFVPICFGFGSPEAVEKLVPLLTVLSLVVAAISAALLLLTRRAAYVQP